MSILRRLLGTRRIGASGRVNEGLETSALLKPQSGRLYVFDGQHFGLVLKKSVHLKVMGEFEWLSDPGSTLPEPDSGGESGSCRSISPTCGDLTVVTSLWSPDCGHLTVGASLWSPHCGHLTVVTSLWSPRCGHLAVVTSLWSPHCGHLAVVTSLWSPHCGHLTVVTSLWSPHCGHLAVVTSLWSPHCGRLTVVTSLRNNDLCEFFFSTINIRSDSEASKNSFNVTFPNMQELPVDAPAQWTAQDSATAHANWQMTSVTLLI
ncbi:hypothetical protein EYF80_027786 [Liparis tanakae]|uniref:Uncharacterized protein n=1 Tax=Liparis tanakae TaxID=230148 RepID=A0A4Z2H8M2_9TELE|nr:hypothetical protein EYF80_027786 [Liparis tanakae]